MDPSGSTGATGGGVIMALVMAMVLCIASEWIR